MEARFRSVKSSSGTKFKRRKAPFSLSADAFQGPPPRTICRLAGQKAVTLRKAPRCRTCHDFHKQKQDAVFPNTSASRFSSPKRKFILPKGYALLHNDVTPAAYSSPASTLFALAATSFSCTSPGACSYLAN